MAFTPARILDVGEVIPLPNHDDDHIRSARRLTDAEAIARMAYCGKVFVNETDVRSGEPYAHSWFCGRKDCTLCGYKRGYELQKRVAALLHPSANLIFDTTLSTYYVYLPHAVSLAYRQRWHNKHCYLNIPQLDGSDLLIFQHTDLIPGALPVDKAFVNDSPWSQLQWTPDDLNVSGKLATTKPVPTTKPDDYVYNPQIFIEPAQQAPRAKDIRAVEQHVRVCGANDLPRTIKELQKALDRRAFIWASELTRRGIAHEIKLAKRNVVLAQINWDNHLITNADMLMRQDIAPEVGFNAVAVNLDNLKPAHIPSGQYVLEHCST
jgi:hypothetical protein